MIKGKSALDLDDMSVEDLTALIQSAEAKRGEKLGQAKRELVEEMQARASKLGLSLNELIQQPAAKHKQTDSKSKAMVKYRKSKNEEWSGRGKTPRWLRALEDAGHDRSEFSV